MKYLYTVIIILFFHISICAQQNNEIYRLEAKLESPNMGSYIVNVLLLDNDKSYEILYQEYITKKRKKKNIIFNLERESGKWRKESDTLYLTNAKDVSETKFLILSKNKITLIIENKNISDINWKRVKL